MRSILFASALAMVASGCQRSSPDSRENGGAASGGLGVTVGGGGSGGSESAAGGMGATSGSQADAGAGGMLPKPAPKYHPPAGFENCKHAEVKADCEGGWCRLPPSCFVMGSPEDDWKRGRDDETQTAVTLTHDVEIQQKELTRAQWEAITKTSAPGPENCTLPNCPVAMVSWWDAVHAANLLSTQEGLAPCYAPVDCTGSLGKDLVCAGVANPDESVYECEGYRLPTRAEAEYAARAGTISTFYSGDITVYENDLVCSVDPALELIAWYCWNSGNRPHVGGELKPNGFGLYDMIGNLGEWNNEEQRYQSSPGGENPRGQVGQSMNRLRFSPQYDDKSYILRTAGLLSAPWQGMANTIGFRLVRTLDPSPLQE